MNGIIHFETFLIAGILLNLSPGNDTIFILTKSISHGRKAGIYSVLGIATGSILHTLFAALGLSLIISESMLLFNMIKFAGAIYLIYLGSKLFFQKTIINAEVINTKSKKYDFKIYFEGLLTNLLNPKVALFFLAFLPQFIVPDYPQKTIAFIILGLSFTLTGTIWCLILANFSYMIFSNIKNNNRISVMLNRICGTVLMALGIKVALSDLR